MEDKGGIKGGNTGSNHSPKRQRSAFADKLNILIAAVIGIAVILAVIVSIVLVKYYGQSQGQLQGASASTASHGAIGFAVVFLSYLVVSVFLVIFFVYRILSPFKRLLRDMDKILMGDIAKRLSLRDEDVFLIKEFVMGVNTLVAKLEQMHLIKDEFVLHIDAEGQKLLSLLEQDKGMSSDAREAVISYHKKFITIVKDKT